MADYISEELINRISEEADIVEVIGEYLPLKKAGKNYNCLLYTSPSPRDS